MASLCPYFHVHQPLRLRRFSVFDRSDQYFDDFRNRELLHQVAQRCYLPAGRMLLDLIERTGGRLRVTLSLTGLLLEQCQRWEPDVLEMFRRLAGTGAVEVLGETYYHSLAFLFSRGEFAEQVRRHADTVEEMFGVRPRVFRNTELIYDNALAATVADLGFVGVITEGVDRLLAGRSPHRVYRAAESGMGVLLRDHRRSDDIAFRFGDRNWEHWPLTPEKFLRWLDPDPEAVVVLGMDYETLGEHHAGETGILDFFEQFVRQACEAGAYEFRTASELVTGVSAVAPVYDVPEPISWADEQRDLSAWMGNAMQRHALEQLYGLEDSVRAIGDSGLLHAWRCLQTSDHFYYMCTKCFADGQVHGYFSPYESPYDSYINFMNVLDHLVERCGRQRAGGAQISQRKHSPAGRPT